MVRLPKAIDLLLYAVRTKLLAKREPYLCGIKITHRCTLKCKQCPYWSRPIPDMTYKVLVQKFTKLREKGVRLLIFEGGEPFLWQDGQKRLEDLVVEAKQYFHTVGITTNGTLPLDTSADIIWVSIDGLKATHDRLRGISFDRIMDNISESNHPKIYANITINLYNYFEIKDLVKFLKGKVAGITIQFFYPYENIEDMSCTAEQRSLVLQDLIDLKRSGYPIADSITVLEALKRNSWTCEPWMIANLEPTGEFNHGCYLLNRNSNHDCSKCGFAAHAEISMAYQGYLAPIMAGRRILGIF